MKRRSFFGAVAAVLIAPFVARANQRKAPPQIHSSVFDSVDMHGLMRMVARSNFHDPIVFERVE